MAKNFRISAEKMKSLVPNYGACIATDRVMVDGALVSYMDREIPVEDVDSGWCFFSGDETDEYLDDPSNIGIYEVNSVANYAPDIIPFLDTAAPCAFERDENGSWVSVIPILDA